MVCVYYVQFTLVRSKTVYELVIVIIILARPTRPTDFQIVDQQAWSVKFSIKHGTHFSKTIQYTKFTNVTLNCECATPTKVITVLPKGNSPPYSIQGLTPYTNYTLTAVTCIKVNSSGKVICSLQVKLQFDTPAEGNKI